VIGCNIILSDFIILSTKLDSLTLRPHFLENDFQHIPFRLNISLALARLLLYFYLLSNIPNGVYYNFDGVAMLSSILARYSRPSDSNKTLVHMEKILGEKI